MDKKVPLACNIRFNAKNPRHLAAAQALSMIAARYKTSFVSLAIEAYLEAHPMGIDVTELLESQKSPRKSYQPKVSIIENIARVETAAQEEHEAQSTQAISDAIDYYNIL